ncbi:MAG: FG-GAP-like repeat-containing protein, partial [Flavobacteriales bacterium]
REWGTENDWEYRNAGGATSITLGEVLYDHLQPGTWYEWQAATTCDGVQTSNSVKHVFKTLTPCEMPTGNAATNLTDTGARVSWSSVLDAENYVMRYRKVGETDYNWRNTGELTYFDITGLDPSSTYEWGVSATCSELASCIAPYLDNYSFETNEEGRATDNMNEVCAIDVNNLTFAQVIQQNSTFEQVGMLQADANNDGMDDLILFSTESGNSIEVFTQSNPFTSNLSSSTTISFQDNYTNCTAGFIDNDDKMDLLLTDMYSNKIHFYRNASIGSNVIFEKMYSMTTDLMPSSAKLVDLQGNSNSELVVTFSGTDQIKLYKKELLAHDALREPNAWKHYKQFITGEAPSMIKSADIDSDGKQDLMIMNDLNEHFTLVYNGNEADSTYYIRSVFPTGGFTKNASIGDLNGDGLLDVVALSQTEQTMSIYQNIGQPGNMMLELVEVLELSAIPNDVVVADLNGDEMGDVALSFLEQSDLHVYQSLNSGQVIISSPNTINTNGPAGELSVMDMNGDGFAEIVCSGTEESNLTVFGNNTPEVAPMISIAKSKSSAFQFNAQADFVSTDWQWQAKDAKSGIWLDLKEQKGVEGVESTTLELDGTIAQQYTAVRCAAKDRSCNQLHISDFLKIKVNQEQLAKLLPNPASDVFTVFVSDASTSEIEISVISTTGELIEYIKDVGIEGSYKRSIDISTWSSGVYYVKIKSNSVQSVEKLIVQ